MLAVASVMRETSRWLARHKGKDLDNAIPSNRVVSMFCSFLHSLQTKPTSSTVVRSDLLSCMVFCIAGQPLIVLHIHTQVRSELVHEAWFLLRHSLELSVGLYTA